MNTRALSFFFALLTAYGAYAYVTFDLRLADSKIYPGTERDIIVTLPDSMPASGPMAAYIGLDGILCNAPAVIDTLVASGDMPPTIGVFIQPGVIKDAKGEVVRYNRSNEFDAINGDFARFLEEEALPAVDSLLQARGLCISPDPNDRMIFGLSSGGIAAFAVAWNRPDLFRRVFSGCGTFVPMRGGNELQALVRKTEPKPLRIFLEDGFSDAWNPLFGSWFEANTLLASALEFAGYDCMTHWHEGGHSVAGANRIFKDVMIWMWRDYPEPIAKGQTSNDLLSPMLANASDWERGAELKRAGAPVAVYPDSSLLAKPMPSSNWLSQAIIDVDGNECLAQRFYWLHSPDNRLLAVGAMAFDGNGNLWVLTDAGLQICDQNGRVRGILSLPAGLDASNSGLEISDGRICVDGYCRRLNVPAAKPGTRPRSQGQG
ncbi:MAG: alpha/beta hydrolase-fold protein [Clostridium sp.]|nr:alpha/beta hydrolase-fold protein [Clostridium sp.]